MPRRKVITPDKHNGLTICALVNSKVVRATLAFEYFSCARLCQGFFSDFIHVTTWIGGKTINVVIHTCLLAKILSMRTGRLVYQICFFKCRWWFLNLFKRKINFSISYSNLISTKYLLNNLEQWKHNLKFFQILFFKYWSKLKNKCWMTYVNFFNFLVLVFVVFVCSVNVSTNIWFVELYFSHTGAWN